MPWCPRCDETFPQGPACPRCSARLVARDRDTDDPLQTVPGLRSIKVSRRYERAFERLSGPKGSSSRALALALVLLVFASGYLLGRVGSFGPVGPVVRALPASEPLPFDGVKGSISYLVASREPLASIAVHDLTSGDVAPRARFSPPGDTGDHVTTRVVSFGRSVALVIESGGQGFVSFATPGRPSHGWIPGFEAAWSSETDLLVRQADGTVVKWRSGPDSVRSSAVGDGDQLLQTASGPVVRRGELLESTLHPSRRLMVPKGAKVIAVSPDTTRAVISDRGRTLLWNGREGPRLRTGGDVLGASFESSGERAAVMQDTVDGLALAIVDQRGSASLKPLGRSSGCEGAPAWDASGRWVYASSSDGVVHAVEASGGRIETIRTQSIGCGVAWVDTP